VRGAILRVLDDGTCTSEWIAGRLGLHPRTLHRHLRREGTSFRLIKDEVRRDLAGYYLRSTDLDIKAISERLGFSEQSALSRRARKWFGAAPSGLRGGMLAEGAANVRLGQVSGRQWE
jgi:AraC-like DNA-binding protein